MLKNIIWSVFNFDTRVAMKRDKFLLFFHFENFDLSFLLGLSTSQLSSGWQLPPPTSPGAPLSILMQFVREFLHHFLLNLGPKRQNFVQKSLSDEIKPITKHKFYFCVQKWKTTSSTDGPGKIAGSTWWIISPIPALEPHFASWRNLVSKSKT